MTIIGLAIGLVAFLIFLVVMRPHPTPLVALAVTNYTGPAPVNAWALEDVERLDKIGNLNVTNVSEGWNSGKDAARAILPAEIELDWPRKNVPVIFYINAHGVVNDEGEPCLLPPCPAGSEANEWKRVSDLFDEILDDKRMGGERNVLVILDSTRIQSDWRLGILYNSFTERVQQLVDNNEQYAKNPHFAVIVSSAPGQKSWASAEFGGSAFGSYLQLGLAGDADENPGFWHSHVSLRELAAYLASKVNEWAEFNRGESQEPILLAAENVDFPLTSVNRSALPDAFTIADESKPTIGGEQLAPLWVTLQQLREKRELVRLDPKTCSRIERRLLRLEQMTTSGRAYAEVAEQSLLDLEGELDKMKRQGANAAKSFALADHLRVYGDANWAVQVSAAHSLPAGEYFGAFDRQRAAAIEGYLQATADSDTSQPASAPHIGGEIDQLVGQLVEAQVFESTTVQRVSQLWSRGSQVIAEVAKLRATAEQLSIPRTANGLPGDERAHYFARQFASKADRMCRESEDTLFIGELNAGSEDFRQLSLATSKLYEWAGSVLSSSSNAYQVSDRAAAETPYLAEWLCNLLASSDDASDAPLISTLQELIAGQRMLGNQLRQIDTSLPADGELPFEPLSRQVKAAYKRIRDSFDKECALLVGGDAVGVPGLQAIDALLLTPLIDGGTRKELIGKRAAISNGLHEQFFESTTSLDRSKAAGTYLERITKWKSHPLLELLQVPLPKDDSEPWRPFESVAPKLREVLASHWTFTSPGTHEQLGEAVLEQRDMLSREELNFRVIAALAYKPIESFDTPADAERDPIEQLRRFDVQQLLFGLSERAIDDFWGVATDNNNEFSFTKVASDYFEAAYDVGPNHNSVPTEVAGAKRLKDLLKSRQQAKRAGLEVGARSSLRIAQDATAEIEIVVSPKAKPTDYPVGRVAVFLRDGTSRMPVRVETRGRTNVNYFPSPPHSIKSVEFEAKAGIEPNVNYLQASTFFRGQSFVREFPVRSLGGIRIAYEPHRDLEQSITLSGDRQQRSSIVFVLDCSYSMIEEADDASEAGMAGVASNRLEQAKKELVEMLNELARRNANGEDIKVGVWLFGHRLNWSSNPSKPIMPAPNYLREIPNNVTPQQDIEEIYSLGEFRDTHAKDVENLLKSVQPWGMTPLYRTVIEVLNANFRNLDARTRATLIVITDGADDDDFRPSNSPLPIPTALEYQDVLNTWSTRRVPIHILGFNLKANSDLGISAGDVAAAKQEYREIARESGGTYADASNSGQLLQLLREQLSVDAYSVKNVSLPSRELLTNDRELPRLNEPVFVRTLQSPKEQFQISFRSSSKEVALEGGEAIVLRVTEDGENIEAVPYDRGVEEDKLLTAGIGGSESNLRLRVHRPIWDGAGESDVKFKFSLQRDPKSGAHFTERPKHTWVEVTPVVGNGKPMPSYVFYDRKLKPDEPVPVLEWTALDWPKGAQKARIEFWCNFESVPEVFLQMSQVQRGKFLPVPGEPNVEIKIEKSMTRDGEQIYVEERHRESSPGIDAIRVRLANGPLDQLEYVEHRFDQKEGVVTHKYRFVGLPDADALQSTTIAIALGRDIKKAAFQLPDDKALEVSVGGRGIAFPIEAAAGGP